MFACKIVTNGQWKTQVISVSTSQVQASLKKRERDRSHESQAVFRYDLQFAGLAMNLNSLPGDFPSPIILLYQPCDDRKEIENSLGKLFWM